MSNLQKLRIDDIGQHRTTFEKNKRILLKTQNTCAICGRPIDKGLKFPHPLSPTVDHVVPIVHGGHPSAMENLQLTHFTCNRAKSDKLMKEGTAHTPTEQVLSNRVLPQSMDWANYKSE